MQSDNPECISVSFLVIPIYCIKTLLKQDKEQRHRVGAFLYGLVLHILLIE